jgi:hypothetical protein
MIWIIRRMKLTDGCQSTRRETGSNIILSTTNTDELAKNEIYFSARRRRRLTMCQGAAECLIDVNDIHVMVYGIPDGLGFLAERQLFFFISTECSASLWDRYHMP